MISYTQYSARGSILSLNSCVRIYVCLGMLDKVTKKSNRRKAQRDGNKIKCETKKTKKCRARRKTLVP